MKLKPDKQTDRQSEKMGKIEPQTNFMTPNNILL